MNVQANNQSPTMILQRIDAIIAELQTLRQQVLTIQPLEVPPIDLVEELAGSLGNGRWDEYDKLLDWKRFDT